MRIKDSKDELAWSKSPALGIYTPKLCYKAMFSSGSPEDTQWWWKDIWKIKAPLKTPNLYVAGYQKQGSNLGNSPKEEQRRS